MRETWSAEELEALKPPHPSDSDLVRALRKQVELTRVWAKDEQAKREDAEDGRLEARRRAATLYGALAFAASVIKSGESWTPQCEDIIGRVLREERDG